MSTSFNKRYDKAAKQHEREQMLCKGIAAQAGRIGSGFSLPNAPTEADSMRQYEVAKRGVINSDPTRRRELGEIEIEIDSGPYAGPHRVRVSHDPQGRSINLHGVHVSLNEIDPALASGFEATAAAFNAAQGTAEQATQRELLAALLDRILRRHKVAADAVVAQLEHERRTAV